jgi:hypothetical protein
MASTLRHLGYLAPSYSRLDGVALTRTLVEHTITFAWITGDPTARLPRFLRSDFSRALDKDRTFRARGDRLLDDALRDRYRAYVRAHSDDLPGIRNRAREADARWLDRAREYMPPPLELPSLVELYDLVYDSFANLDHPSVTALQTFVHMASERPEVVVDGVPEQDREAELRPYWLGLWSLAWALTVSSLATGRPRAGVLRETISQIRALREFERHGLLEITQRGPATEISLVPDADDRIDRIAEALEREHEGDLP